MQRKQRGERNGAEGREKNKTGGGEKDGGVSGVSILACVQAGDSRWTAETE